jgi:hypothetical protein
MTAMNIVALYSIPLQQFHVLFTLSSECFSTFPHGTCSLSDLQSYLAFGETYLHFELHFQIALLIRLGPYWSKLKDAQNGFVTLYEAVFQQTSSEFATI